MKKLIFEKLFGFGKKIKYIAYLNLLFRVFSIPLNVNRDGNSFVIYENNLRIHFYPLDRIYIFLSGLTKRLNQLADEYFLNEIEFIEEDIILDCGANIGELAYFFRNMNINYYAFEPSPNLFESLVKNLDYFIGGDSYFIELVGLSNKNKNQRFYLRDSGADSSIEYDSNSDYVDIETIKLDSFFDNLNQIKLLKIDAEGFEKEVLEGAINILKKIKYLSVDAGYERGNKQIATFKDVNALLINQNFELLKTNNLRNTYLYKNSQL